ncbi:MAG: hypothetical protein OEY85_11325 [Rhodospirillales bacterium]|nr:hypothetical protein [Rhodospirillales bacterium]
MAGGLFASAAHAKPLSLTDAQMDQVAAGGVSTVDGFVCPVITTDAVLNASGGVTAIAIAGGHYSIVGPDVSTPLIATNGDGAGSPGGAHSAPGDTTYTAIWAK